MLIEELVTLGKMLYKEGKTALRFKQTELTSAKIKSLAQTANQSTYYFPVVASDNLTSSEVTMLMKALERQYMVFTRTAFSLVPAIQVDSIDKATMTNYLKQFHSNIGMRNAFDPESLIKLFDESYKEKTDNLTILNEDIRLLDINEMNPVTGKKGSTMGGDPTILYNTKIDQEWKKANELIPTTMMAPITVYINGGTDATEFKIPVNIKATMHRVNSMALTNDIASTSTKKRGFLNFVKFISGEQKSLTEFLFAVSHMKQDALDNKKNPWLTAFKRRKRLANMTWNYVSENYKPIGTVVLTMDEVNQLKVKYDLDIFKESNKIMDEYLLLGFVILDQVNEVAHMKFDGQEHFQEYAYRTLEREGNNQDRAIKDMIKAMGSFR